jgi:hypothetical protein
VSARLRDEGRAVTDMLDIPGLAPSPDQETTAGAPRASERMMLDRLNTRYGAYNGNGIRYTRAEHVKITAGFDARRICDYMAFDLWAGSNGGPVLHGHEVKVSRSDWLTELRDPSKAEAFAVFCDFWWLVVSDRAIVRPGELPDGWGLMVASGASVRVVTPARRRTPEAMPRHLQATLTRAVTKTALRLTIMNDPAFRYLGYRAGLERPEETA